ncbi:MAG: DUF1579 domain-containing protein [Anaerolineaceae bacterium]|nr:DUF1579 domain-containing protein [Anaerolineaceae bacterium]
MMDDNKILEQSHPQLASLVGKWQGMTKTWFEPDKLADESPWQGEFRLVLGGRFLFYTYHGSMQGKPLEGMAMLGYNPQRQRYEMAWVDTFHNGSAIMFMHDSEKDKPFNVLGSFPTGPDSPDWGWRTEITFQNNGELVITHYGITPESLEWKGVETIYQRISE